MVPADGLGDYGSSIRWRGYVGRDVMESLVLGVLGGGLERGIQ